MPPVERVTVKVAEATPSTVLTLKGFPSKVNTTSLSSSVILPFLSRAVAVNSRPIMVSTFGSDSCVARLTTVTTAAEDRLGK